MINYTQAQIVVEEARKNIENIGFLPIAGLVILLTIIGVTTYLIFFKDMRFRNSKLQQLEI